MSRPEILDYPAYLRRWRELHGLEPDRMAPLLDRWYRLPYALARPIAGVHPNLVTLAGVLVAAASVAGYLGDRPWLGGLLALLSGLFDQLDGAVAVMSRRETAFGAVWDSAADRVSDLLLLVGPALWLLPHAAGAWGLAAAGAALFLLEFVRARCHASGWVSDQVITPAERPTRVIVAGLTGIVAPGLWPWVAWGLAVLGAVSVAILLRDAARRGRGTPTTPASA